VVAQHFTVARVCERRQDAAWTAISEMLA